MIIAKLYGIGLAVSAIIIICLVVRRIKIKKTEDFEKRND